MRLSTIDNIYASVQKARGDTSEVPDSRLWRRHGYLLFIARHSGSPLHENGLRKGDIGAVVHVHGDSALEVEFVRASGRTQIVVPRDTRMQPKRDYLEERFGRFKVA